MHAFYQKHTTHILKNHLVTAESSYLSKQATECTRHQTGTRKGA